MSFSIETRCQHLADEQNIYSQNTYEHYGAISYPIYQTATFAHPAVGESTGFDYSRLQNPTRERVEKMVAALEGGTHGFAFSSGMAAISALMEMLRPGDHLIIDADLYGGSIRLFDHISRKNGIEFTRVNCNEEDLESFITDRTRAVFIETPTNPMMNVTDIRELAKITKKHELLFIVDNTFLSPYFQNPLKSGADIVVHSGTKFLGGHNDTIAGFVVTNDEAVSEKLQFIIKTTGAGLSPFDSWLILRGIKTLAVRMERAQENAIMLSRWLKEQKAVNRVIYPGLPSHPGYEMMKKQCSGFGTMITFEVISKNAALAILKNVRLISFAESLGGTETLITYPITQTHADVPEEVRQKNGITDRILRMSVGIEKIDDIIADLNDAFALL